MKRKICFIVGDLNCSGGTERVTSLIANELVKYNYDISILSLKNGANPFFDLDDNIKIYSLNNKKVSFKKKFISTILGIRNFVNNNNIDTVVSVESITCIFSIPALIGLKINHICWEHFNFNVDLGSKYRNLARKLAARQCNYIVTLTKRDEKLWRNGLANIRAKIISIPNPSTFENINNYPSLDSKIVLAVGRYRYQKGYDLLMEAWSKVNNKNGWKLVTVGDGEDKQEIIELAKSLNVFDTIEINPPTEHIIQYFRKASFYCMSSRFEGLPMVLLEAQSFSLPIVSFDCDTGPAELINNGVSGYLVEAENVEKLSEAITNMINIDPDSYLEMCKSAKENINNFKVDEIIKKWLIIL